MADLPADFALTEGETVIISTKTEWVLPNFNPIVCIIWAIIKFILMILGVRIQGFLIVTNKRVVEVWEYIVCWCFNARRHTIYVKPSSVKEVSFVKRSILCCCWKIHCLYYGALTGHSALIKMKGADESTVLKTAEAFYTAIEHAKE